MKKSFVWLAVLALAALACSVSVDLFNPPPIATPFPNAPASPTPNILLPTFTPVIIQPLPATLTSLPPTPVNNTPALTVDQLKNATLTIMGSDQILRTIDLKDGKYQSGSDPAQVGYIQVSLGDTIALGDLNGDGAQDALLVMGENFGGSGVFVSLVAVLNQGGQPNAVATQPVDDRAIVNSLTIQPDGEISLNATVHGPNDPACCAAQVVIRNYRLIEQEFIGTSVSSATPTGTFRTIKIESPVKNAQVDKIFTVKGSFTIAPFENTLSYAVYIPSMTDPFTQGPITVSAAEMGGPGTFELPLNFTAAGYSGPVRIVISDLSAADGSVLAQDTMFVTVK